jgi:hypothetical protein
MRAPYRHHLSSTNRIVSHALCTSGIAWLYHMLIPLSTESPLIFLPPAHAGLMAPMSIIIFG